MKILLFNRNEQYIATLRDVLSAKHTEELNGENILEIETLDEIEKNQRLIYKDKYGYWHEFIVRGVEEERTEAGIIRRVFAEHSFYETWGDYIEDRRPYDVPANIALSVALEPTRWKVGIVDDLGINSTNFYHISAKEAVQKVAETWQGELRYRIEVSGNRIAGRYVDLLARRGHDLGKRFTYTKDLISITKTVHRDDVITALYGYGKGQEIVDEEGQPTGGYGRRIDFADINNGKAYVENLEAKEIWGRLNPDGTRSHVFGKVEFDDVEDPHKLLELTKEKLKELSQPHITYEAKVIDLKALGIEHEGVELGDWVGIVDKEFKPPLRLKARVIKIVRDLLEPENTEITLGNFVPSITDAWLEQEKYISNFRDKQGVWDRSSIIGKDKTIDTQYLDGIIDVLKNKLLASRSGWYTDDKGNLIFENADKTAAMMLTGEGFMIASNKLPNGEYDWRTFGTGNGFIADYIVAGVLKGGKVHFDLTNGTLLIGNNTEDYNLYFDGNNLSIKLSNNKSIETALTELETGLQDYTNQKTQEAIDNIQIGGRNLLPNSEEEKINDGSQWRPEFLRTYDLAPIFEKYGLDREYSLSFELKSADTSKNNRIKVYMQSGNGTKYNFINKIVEVTEEYQRFVFEGLKPTEGTGGYNTAHLSFYGTYDTGNIPIVRKMKLELGNKATDWTPAPEDVQEELDQTAKTETVNELLNNITSQYDQALNNATENILDEVDNRIEGKSVILRQEIISEFELTAEQLQLSFTELQEILDGNNSLINSLTTYFNFSTDGFTIGKSDSPFKINLTNEQMTFLENEAPVAWINAQRLYITNAQITNSFILGNHIWEKYNDQLTFVRYLG
jgi:phage minor structural protein